MPRRREIESAVGEFSYTVSHLPEPRGILAALVALPSIGYLRRAA